MDLLGDAAEALGGVVGKVTGEERDPKQRVVEAILTMRSVARDLLDEHGQLTNNELRELMGIDELLGPKFSGTFIPNLLEGAPGIKSRIIVVKIPGRSLPIRHRQWTSTEFTE